MTPYPRGPVLACLAVALLVGVLAGGDELQTNPGELTVKLMCALLLLALIWTMWEGGAG